MTDHDKERAARLALAKLLVQQLTGKNTVIKSKKWGFPQRKA